MSLHTTWEVLMSYQLIYQEELLCAIKSVTPRCANYRMN